MEIYDLGSDVRAIDEVKQGRRTPRLCVFKAPEPQEAGKVAIHHVISGMETGARVALAKVGSLELTGGAIRYVFRDFVSVPDRPFLSIGSVLGTLYPVGEAHATSGVWQMDLGKAVRFVPQQWCAESYLSVNLPVSAGADKPQSGSAGGAPPGGSAGPNPPSPSSPGAGTSADTNRCE